MIIGVLFSGIIAGVLGTVGALALGLPLWIAIMLYPIIGTLGSIGFISVSLPRDTSAPAEASVEFAATLR